MKQLALLLSVSLFLPVSAHAADPVAKNECSVQENVSLMANFMVPVASFEEGKAAFEEKHKQLNGFAAKQGVKSYTLQSTGYTVIAQPMMAIGQQEATFQLNGSVSYVIDSVESAFKFANFLTQQKFQVNVGVTKTYSTSCPPSPEKKG